jgi:hypothetical protein
VADGESPRLTRDSGPSSLGVRYDLSPCLFRQPLAKSLAFWTPDAVGLESGSAGPSSLAILIA